MIVYGKNVAIELLNRNYNIRKIVLQDNFSDEKIISLIENKKIPTQIKAKRQMDDLAGGLHQGIILDIEDYQYKKLDFIFENDLSFVVILDHIEDPHNLGAIVRTCEAAGVDAIIIPKDRQVGINATVMKTSAGAIFNTNIIRVSNLANTIKQLKKNNFWIIGTDMQGTNYTELDYTTKTAIVIGNEGQGMSEKVKKNCDFLVKIPMKGKVTSLNASVSTGIVVYEAVKQRM